MTIPKPNYTDIRRQREALELAVKLRRQREADELKAGLERQEAERNNECFEERVRCAIQEGIGDAITRGVPTFHVRVGNVDPLSLIDLANWGHQITCYGFRVCFSALDKCNPPNGVVFTVSVE